MQSWNYKAGRAWLAFLLLITVTSSLVPRYVVAGTLEETEAVALPVAESSEAEESEEALEPEQEQEAQSDVETEEEELKEGESDEAEVDVASDIVDTEAEPTTETSVEESEETKSNVPQADEDRVVEESETESEFGQDQELNSPEDIVGEDEDREENVEQIDEVPLHSETTVAPSDTATTTTATTTTKISESIDVPEADVQFSSTTLTASGGTASSSDLENKDGGTGAEAESDPDEVDSSGAGTSDATDTDLIDIKEATEDQELVITGTSTASSSQATTEILSTSTSTEAVAGAYEDAIASSSAPGVKIESGKAVALANVINIVNTNFVNSEGVVFFSNFLEAVNESIDFRWLYDALAQFGCSLRNCNDTDVTVNSSDTSTIDNYLYLEAVSGNNVITNADSATISTGDAYAGLNLVNVANMNFIDSNYLLVTLNAFSDVNGDLVFPSADAFLSSLASAPSSASVSTSNTATISDNVTVDANSGDNVLEASGGGSISTGASGATSNVFNQINSTLIGGQNVTILFRIHGDWVGDVFGAPADLKWQEGADGSVFVFDTDSAGGGVGAGTSVLTNNQATINNDVNVVALTGENKITGTETGLISTGNAYAGANIVNLANGTVVGRNWILAIINIFGDFKGNIAFGRPDLWVGEIIDAPKKVREGSKLTYTFSVINNGDSTASDVVLTDAYDSQYLELIDASVPYTFSDSGKLQFMLGSLKPAEATEITYTARVVGVGEKSRKITNEVTVTSRETDDNVADNTDTATIVTTSSGSGSGATRVGVRRTESPTSLSDITTAQLATDARALTVSRVSSVTSLSVASPVIQQLIELRNTSNQTIPSVSYIDTLKDVNGNIIEEQVWDLGDVVPNEVIELGYTIRFENGAPSGEYRFTSVVKSGSDERVYANGLLSFIGEQAPTFITTDNVAPQPLVEGVWWTGPEFSSVETLVASPEESDTYNPWNFEFPIDERNIFSMALASHSLSTATEQRHNDGLTILSWFSQLYGYISTFFSKALAMKT